MLDVLRHESFYKTGTFVDELLGVYVGWTSLESSLSAQMPLRNQRGNVVLVFSGEEFSGPDTLRDLRKNGHVAETGGSSYLTSLYEKDPSFPASLDGMFHGLVVDRIRGTATLFNDRYGMYRLYYHESKDAFYFAAEAKAILTVRPELRKPDARSLGEFVALSCVLQDRTLFEGIHRLPGAASWSFRNGLLERKSTYFQPREWEEQPTLDSETYYRELRETVSRNLPKYFSNNGRVGIALTGGLDTRVIMAWQKAASDSLACYTFGGPFRDSKDILVARQVASVCGHPHQVISVDGDFLKHFPHYAERTMYLTEGTVDLSRSPDLYVSERAREIAPVKVVGTYGSEIITQIPMFKPIEPAPGLFRAELLSEVRNAATTYAELRREHPLTFSAFRQSPWYHSGVLALEQTQLKVRSPFLNNEFVRAVFRAPKAAHENGDVRLRLIGDGNAALGRIPSDRGVGELRGRYREPSLERSSNFRSGQNTPTTLACPNGLLGSITCCRPYARKGFFLAGTSSTTSEFGTEMHSPDTFGTCCSTLGRFRVPTSTAKASKLRSWGTSKETATTPPTFTSSFPWNCCIAFFWTPDDFSLPTPKY